jgi:AcrR family transcriptional regulator
LRDRFRAETREVILSAAERALGEHGARGAKMEVIAASAGIAVGTLYNYFADRQELIDALFELRRREFIDRLDAALAGEARFEGQLQAFFAAGLGHFRAHREFLTLVLHDELASERGSRWAMALEVRGRAERLIQSGVEAGVLRAEDRHMYPHLLLGALKGVIEAIVDARDGLDEAALLGSAVRCFLDGARRMS